MLAQPEMQINCGIYKFMWPDLKIEAVVDRIVSNGKQVLTGEIALWHKSPGMPELLEQTRLNLSSNQARNQLAKALAEREAETDWVSVVKYICVLILNHYRKGEPIVEIGRKPKSMDRVYQLYPLLEKGEPTTLFGHGGTGKSYMADYIAVLVQLNEPGIYSLLPEFGNVLILDWETSQSIHEKRIWAIKQGMGINSQERIFYRFCNQPLADDIAEIQRNVMDYNASLVIIDSQVAACGDDPEKAESVNRYYNALRSLKVTTLTIDHVPKNTEAGKNMPFGSVFKWNRARSLLELRKCQEPGQNSLELGLFHRKCNEGKLLKPIGIKIRFHYGPDEALEKVTFNELDMGDIPELAKGLKLKDRLIGVLKYRAMTVAELADELDTTKGTVRVELNKYKKDVFIKVGDKWGLKAF